MMLKDRPSGFGVASTPVTSITPRPELVFEAKGESTEQPLRLRPVAVQSGLLDRVGVCRLLVAIKKQIGKLCSEFIFEPNDALTRGLIKNSLEQYLDSIVERKGLVDYIVVCDETNNSSTSIDRNELWVDLALKPTRAVEFFYVPVRVSKG